MFIRNTDLCTNLRGVKLEHSNENEETLANEQKKRKSELDILVLKYPISFSSFTKTALYSHKDFPESVNEFLICLSIKNHYWYHN